MRGEEGRERRRKKETWGRMKKGKAGEEIREEVEVLGQGEGEEKEGGRHHILTASYIYKYRQTHRVSVDVNWLQEGGRVIIGLQYVQKLLCLLHPQLKERCQKLEMLKVK